jgi:hypothetical protein
MLQFAEELDAVGKHLKVNVAVARAVEFREEDALPTTESEFSLLHEDEGVPTDQHGLDVRVRVALHVAIRSGGGDEPIEGALGIGSNVGIGMFVDQDARGGVRRVEEAGAGLDAKGSHDTLDLVSDINHLSAAIRLYSDGLHGKNVKQKRVAV